MKLWKSIKNKIQGISDGAKSGAVYTLASLLSRGLAIITVPIFTRIMTEAQIGEVNLYNSWYAMISVVATLSLTSGGFQVMMKEYPLKRDEYQSSVLTLTSLVAILLAAVYFCAPDFWNGITGLPTELTLLMLVGFLVAPASDFWMLRQRYEYKYKLSACLTVGSAIVATALSVTVVLAMGKGNEWVVDGRLFSNYAVVYGVAAGLFVFLMWKGKTFFHKEFWKKSLQLSIPLVGYALAAQVLNVSDRTMIASMVGKDAVGIYGTLYTVASISTMVWGALNSAYIPYLYKNIDQEGNQIKKTSTMLLGAYALVAVLCVLLAPEIVRILATEKYYEGIYIMPPIAAGIFLTSVCNMYSNVILYYKKTVYIMVPCIVAAALNVVLNFIFIPQHGYVAAAYTTLVAYIVFALLEGVFATWLRRKERKKTGNSYSSVYDDKMILFLSALTIGISLVGVALYQLPILRYAFTVLFLAALCGLGILYLRKKRKGNHGS